MTPLGFQGFNTIVREHAFAAVWALVFGTVCLVCAVNLSASEWFPRLLVPSLKLLLLGGVLPLAFPAASSTRAWRFTWYTLLLAMAAASVCQLAGSSASIPFAAALLVLLAARSFRRVSARPLRLGLAWGLFALAFAPWFQASSVDGSQIDGRQLFEDYGCILCHRRGDNSLVGLPNRLERRLSFEGRAVASPRAWIYLHLYAPGALSQGRTCPPYRSLFAKRRSGPGVPFPWALPIATPEGEELVPTARARRLADYLLSLRVPDTAGSASREATLARGEQLFYAKCAVCHGRDAQGDNLNYPPLDDPHWLNLPEHEFLDIVMNGKKGKIEVRGREWDGVMLPPGIADPRDATSIRLYLQNRFPAPAASLAPLNRP